MEWKSYTKSENLSTMCTDDSTHISISIYIDCIIGLISLYTHFGCLSLSLTRFFVYSWISVSVNWRDKKHASRFGTHFTLPFFLLLQNYSNSIWLPNLISSLYFMCTNNVNSPATTSTILSPQSNRFSMPIDHNNKCILNKYNLNIINSFEMNQFSKYKKIFTKTTAIESVFARDLFYFVLFFLLKLQFAIENNMLRFSRSLPEIRGRYGFLWLREHESFVHNIVQKENLI